MARSTSKRKGKSKTPLKIGKPEQVTPTSWGYRTVGPNGSTFRLVNVPEPEQQTPSGGPPKTKDERAAERAHYRKTGAGELLGIRKHLVKHAASSPNPAGVLAELWAIERALAEIAGKAPRVAYAVTVMRAAHSDASDADIQEAMAAVPDDYDPTRRTAGTAFGMTSEIWENIGAPAYIWPTDRDAEWIAHAKAATAKTKAAARKERFKETHKAPKKETVAEAAERLGLSKRTMERRLAAERAAETEGTRSSGGKTGTLLEKNIGLSTNLYSERPSGVPQNPPRPAETAAPCAPADEPEQASNDRVSAPVGSANGTARETSEAFGEPECGCLPLARHTAGTDHNPPLLLQRCKTATAITLEDIDTMQNDGADAPAGAEPIESEADSTEIISDQTARTAAPESYALSTAESLPAWFLEQQRRLLERQAAKRAEQAHDGQERSSKVDRPAGASGRPGAATGRDRATVYSGLNRRSA